MIRSRPLSPGFGARDDQQQRHDQCHRFCGGERISRKRIRVRQRRASDGVRLWRRVQSDPTKPTGGTAAAVFINSGTLVVKDHASAVGTAGANASAFGYGVSQIAAAAGVGPASASFSNAGTCDGLGKCDSERDLGFGACQRGRDRNQAVGEQR